MKASQILPWITGGGFTATVLVILRGVYILGSILESFRQHVRSSDETHSRTEERLRYLERRTQ